MPSTKLEDSDFDENGNVQLLDIMLKASMIKSKGEGRRLIQQGGITVNDEKITDPYTSYEKDLFIDGIIVKKGKKVFRKFCL